MNGTAGPRGTARTRGHAPAYAGMLAEARTGMFANAATSLAAGRTGRSEDIASAVERLIGNTFAAGVLFDLDGGARMPVRVPAP